jgi:hypothetical protein
LKRICRRNQIHKWPYRQLASVIRRIEDLKNGKYDYSDEEEDEKADKNTKDNITLFRFPHEVSKKQINKDIPPPQIGPHGRVVTNVETKIRYLEDEKKRIIQSAHLETPDNKQWSKQEHQLPLHSALKKKSSTIIQQVLNEDQKNKQQQQGATRLPSLAFCQERSKKTHMRTLAEEWRATQYNRLQESISSFPLKVFDRPALHSTQQQDGLLGFLADICSDTISSDQGPIQRKTPPCLPHSDHLHLPSSKSLPTRGCMLDFRYPKDTCVSPPYKFQVKNTDAKSSLLLLSLRK